MTLRDAPQNPIKPEQMGYDSNNISFVEPQVLQKGIAPYGFNSQIWSSSMNEETSGLVTPNPFLTQRKNKF